LALLLRESLSRHRAWAADAQTQGCPRRVKETTIGDATATKAVFTKHSAALGVTRPLPQEAEP